jgi:hypothetical protein
MKGSKVKVGRSGRWYPRRAYWIQQRNLAFERAGMFCEVSGEVLGVRIPDSINPESKWIWKWKRAVDHIWPEKFCRVHIKGTNPHLPENLLTITTSLHGRKTPVEVLAFRGDFLGYYRELNRLGYDRAVVDKAYSALIRHAKERNQK